MTFNERVGSQCVEMGNFNIHVCVHFISAVDALKGEGIDGGIQPPAPAQRRVDRKCRCD